MNVIISRSVERRKGLRLNSLRLYLQNIRLLWLVHLERIENCSWPRKSLAFTFVGSLARSKSK